MVHVSFIYILHLLAGTATTIEPIRSRNSEHFLRGLSTASTRIVVRTARPPARAASALWIDERGAQQATGLQQCVGSLFKGRALQRMRRPQLWFSSVVYRTE